MIRIKRVYDPPGPRDGDRILIDRLWPRGVSKERACVSAWRKDLAPSDRLRKWFNHAPGKWDEFRRRYHEELRSKLRELKELAQKKRPATITLLYGARDTEHNNAVALKNLLENLKHSDRGPESDKAKRDRPLRSEAREGRHGSRASGTRFLG